MRIVAPTEEGLKEAARLLRLGEVIAYPTETVYGLGANPFSEEAIHRTFQAKSRDEGNPVLLIIADQNQLDSVVAEVSPAARRCMEAFWPGPISLLFPKNPQLPQSLTAGHSKVCVRCPACSTARALCKTFGGAITSTSANRSGAPPALSPKTIDLPGVDFIIDGGVLAPSLPSTVFDPDEHRVLREGAITEDAIRRSIGLSA